MQTRNENYFGFKKFYELNTIDLILVSDSINLDLVQLCELSNLKNLYQHSFKEIM